jgi:hypothetical protein
MRVLMAGVLGMTLGLGGFAVRADDVCEPKERTAANAGVASAKAAEAAGNLQKALDAVSSGDVRTCSNEGDALYKRFNLRLGQQAEKAGQLAKAFDYFEAGGYLDDARRVALANVHAKPTDRSLAGNVLGFLKRNGFADGVAEVQGQARAQAQRLLAQEDKTFAIREPHTELLREAGSWLSLAGDEPAADVKKRALARGDQFAALDYHYALGQALSYYDLADRNDKQALVKAKAVKLADSLAKTENWSAAVELYDLADERKKAEALQASREASAAKTETDRKGRFDKEQGDLEKQLGL